MKKDYNTFSKLFVYFLFTGMSQIAALLLMYLVEEEDAFWGLHNLMVNTYNHFHIKMEHFKENGNEYFSGTSNICYAWIFHPWVSQIDTISSTSRQSFEKI